MANPKIEVEIGAVIDGLRKGFGESVKIIETLEKQALDLDKALKAATDLPTIQGLNTQLAQTKAALSQLKSSGIDPLTKATSNYNSVGIDFARIVQDAPFGIIGVGNNIQQLAGSFQQLKNSTGSTSAALKQSLASIFSSGNALVLGISLLTTAFTVLQMKGFFDTEKKAKDLTDTLNEYKKTLGETAQAQLEAANNADKEIVKITSLRGVIENETISREKRLAAVKQLREEAPSIFKNLSDEQILAGQVGDSYARLTQILVARATASSGINKIVALADEERIILEKNAATLQQISAFEQKAAKFRAEGQQELVLINENQIRFLKEQNPEIQRLAQIEAERVKLTSLVNDNLAASVDYTGKSKESLNQNKEALEKYSKGWDELNLQQESASFLTDKLTLSTKEYEKAIVSVLTRNESNGLVPEVTGDNAWDQYTYSIYQFRDASIQANAEITETSTKALEFSNNLDKIANKEVNIKTNFDEFGKELADVDKSKLSAFVVRLAEFNSQVSGIIESGAQQTLGDFAFAIGDALASGGNVLKAAGSALLGGIAGILNQLGQLAIGAGLAVEGIKKALTSLNPAVAIAAGVALVALAGFVSSKAKSLGGGARGGGGGGGGSSVGSSGVGGGSSFVGGGAQGGMFAQNRDVSGEFVVRGQDLVYVLGQSENRIKKG
jgi:hypothetical protein